MMPTLQYSNAKSAPFKVQLLEFSWELWDIIAKVSIKT